MDLIHTINQAVSHKRLEEQSRRLLKEFQRQAALLERVKDNASELFHLETDEQGALLVDETEANGEITDLVAEIERAMAMRRVFS